MNLKEFNNYMDKQFDNLINILCPKQQTKDIKNQNSNN